MQGLMAVCLTILLLVGCTAGGSPDSAAGNGRGPGVSNPATPAYPRDQVVLQVAYGGGFRMIDRVSNEIPDVTVWGDGRVVFAAPDGSVREGRLEPAVVGRLVGSATFLYDLKDSYEAVTHTDAPGATFTVFTNQGRKTVSVYGLDPEHAREGEPHPEVFSRLRDLWAQVYAAVPADAPEMVPSVVRVITLDSNEATTAVWPEALQGRLTGDQARRAAELAGLREARTFLLGGKPMLVLVVPILPQPGAWEEDPIRLPERLTGQGEDEALSLKAEALRQPDDSYRVTVTVQNQTERGVDLLFDCGALLRWEGLQSAEEEQDEACPAVYSQLLEAGKTQEIGATLPPGSVADWNALSVSILYEDGGNGSRAPHSVTARLHPDTP